MKEFVSGGGLALKTQWLARTLTEA